MIMALYNNTADVADAVVVFFVLSPTKRTLPMLHELLLLILAAAGAANPITSVTSGLNSFICRVSQSRG